MPDKLTIREVRFPLAHGYSTVEAPKGAKVLDIRFYMDRAVVVVLLVSERLEKAGTCKMKFLILAPGWPIETEKPPVIKKSWSMTHKRYPHGVQVIHCR